VCVTRQGEKEFGICLVSETSNDPGTSGTVNGIPGQQLPYQSLAHDFVCESSHRFGGEASDVLVAIEEGPHWFSVPKR